MHIGFDISQTGSGKAGCGFFAHALIKAMLEVAPEFRYSLFPSFGDFYFDALMPIKNPYPGRKVKYGPRHLSREAVRAFWNNPDLELVLDKPDVIHANNFWCPLQLTSSRLVYTFYDMGFNVNPAWSFEANRIGCFEGVYRASIVADWIVAISEASRSHFLETFPHFPKNRVCVIYPCSRFTDTSTLGGKPKSLNNIGSGEFWLNVGTIEPRKNQRRLVRAYARYLDRGGTPKPLVLAGGKGWLMDDFKNYIDSLGISDQVITTGYVSEEEMIWLYRHCYVHIYPSLFEGFGLPVLEGMQFGAPTITSNVTSVPEVAGKAAILVDPEDTDSLASAMLHLDRNRTERDRLASLSRAQSERFDCKRSAAELVELYKEALTFPKRSIQE